MGTPLPVGEYPVRRLLARDEARKTLVGERVPELQPTVVGPSLLLDADTAEPVALYAPLAEAAELRRAVRALPFQTGVPRTGLGYRSMSRTFGHAPRRPMMKRDGCAPTATSRDHPDLRDTFARWATRLEQQLAEALPEAVAQSAEEASAILPEWRLDDRTLWTSGVVNQTVSLPYHTDSANFDVWSAMPVFRRGVIGGYLHMPEYGAVFECRDSWCLWFPGYRLVHGVTPMTKRAEDAYRYSVVYYALRGMKDCGTVAAETALAQRKRTERERAAAAALAERLVQQ